MSRTDDEPIFIAEFADRESAELAWAELNEEGIAGTVITDDPPWGRRVHRLQVARIDAANALRLLEATDR